MNFKRVLSIFMTLFLLVSFIAYSEEPEEIFEVHFLSVGDNDGILLRAGDECAFIDSGNYTEGPICAEYLKSVGVTNLKYYIGTHAHRNHVGGAAYILSAIPTEGLIYTHEMVPFQISRTAKTDEEKAVLETVEHYPTNYMDVYTLGGATLRCVGPESYSNIYSYNSLSENDNSMLLHVTFGNISFFLTGDSPNRKVLQMNKNHPEVLKSTVIKAPHHGGGFSKDVYGLIDTEYMIYSTSDIGLPPETHIKMAMAYSDNILITADNRNGNIIFRTDGKTLTVQTEFDYDYSAQ